MEYVLKTYPDVVRLMLATSVHFSEVNFHNYIRNGFPVDSPAIQRWVSVLTNGGH